MAAAAAGSARAAGDPSAAGGLLDQADALHAKAPTYCGGAWAALGRILLTTPWLRVAGC